MLWIEVLTSVLPPKPNGVVYWAELDDRAVNVLPIKETCVKNKNIISHAKDFIYWKCDDKKFVSWFSIQSKVPKITNYRIAPLLRNPIKHMILKISIFGAEIQKSCIKNYLLKVFIKK